VEAFVVQRSIDLTTFDGEFPLVLVELAGGHQPAATLEEFLAHLSLSSLCLWVRLGAMRVSMAAFLALLCREAKGRHKRGSWSLTPW
jgi:hypothetical protein